MTTSKTGDVAGPLGHPVITTPRLILRRCRPGDADAVFAYRSDPAVARHLASGVWSREKIERELAAYAVAPFGGPGDELVLLAETRSESAVVGEVGLVWRPGTPATAEIGFVFDPAAGGRGYATEAARGVLGLAFGDLGFTRVLARTDAQNTASRALCERLGMSLRELAAASDGRGVEEAVYDLSAS